MITSASHSAVGAESVIGKLDKNKEAEHKEGTDQTNISSTEVEATSDKDSLLKFRTNLLRQHIVSAREVRSNDLRTPELDALIETLSTLADVLCTPDNSFNLAKENVRKRLESYAAMSWMDVLQRIQHAMEKSTIKGNPIKASDEQARLIVDALYQITSNNNNRVSQVIGRAADSCYDNIGFHFFKICKGFAARALELEQLPVDLRSWAERTVAQPWNLLQTLARGHVIQCFEQVLHKPIMKSYELALKATKTVGLLKLGLESGLEFN